MNNIVNGTGATIDVLFSEAVNTAFVQTPGNRTTSDATQVISATQIGGTIVRVVLDGKIRTAATCGVTNVPDLADNAGGGAISVDPAE